ncbi:MAG TPA: SulP family inorganic anion transporter [Humidesulfovibrio sp.]|uniref:SLC26A/SulP transporter family protein n=1 Tax=Humidesulfovibrio sp. TaxID=2910988 RepID=UPI002B771F59|nr:SulP family inorganic anion transporter [Humidesulfovibrio sp.]HWR03374.1 SulP family inorganic anion transporter [Humidesulfovibrio sp.]
MSSTSWQELLHDATTPQRCLPALCSGLLVGMLLIVIQLSLASLIFSGPLAPFAPQASGLPLFGCFVMCLLVALFSSVPTAICVPEDSPAAILASVAAGIATALSGAVDPRAAYVTVGAAMALSALGTGALFLLLGRFRLGNLVRYMPYPVVGGFLAGVGWLLARGSIIIMTGETPNLTNLAVFFTGETLALWLPGLALALALLAASKLIKNGAALPATIGTALAAFAVYLWATGQSLADAERTGLLLGGIEEGARLWPVFGVADLSLIRWDLLAQQIPQLCTIPLVSAISFLLVSSGMEAMLRRDLDMRHELYLNAAVNFIAAPGGSHTGFTALSYSMLGPMTGSNSRLVGVTAGLLAGVAAVSGASVLAHVPRFVLGGLTMFMGLATMLEWAVRMRTRVTRAEYGLVLAILCSVGIFGFLPGVAFGLVMAAAVFVIKYSQLPVVRQEAEADGPASTVRRSIPEQHILRDRAGAIRVLHISGYLFFGSANTLNRTVSQYLSPQKGAPLGYIVLDFSDVNGFDSSALNCLLRMVQRCTGAGLTPLFAAAPEGLAQQMRRTAPDDAEKLLFLPSLDSALEWCEDDILARFESTKTTESQDALFDSTVDDLLAQIEKSERFEAMLESLAPYLEARSAAPDETILDEGAALDGVLLFASGQAEETRMEEGAAPVRLRTLKAGALVGRASAEQAYAAPGRIVALTPCSLFFLSLDALARLEAENPGLAITFYHQYTAAPQH